MKADVTRDTFDPLKHYTRVLTQQGRVQLDADSNEQNSIVLQHYRELAVDLIGPASGPAGNLGFGIAALPNASPADFRIGFGHYYVNGLLCRAEPSPIEIFPTGREGVFRVRNWSVDFERAPGPPFELFDDVAGSTFEPVVVQIANADRAAAEITIADMPRAGASIARPALRRIITYLHQPDFVHSSAPGAVSPPSLPAGVVQVFLDVWERVITYAEDDSIRDVALGGPDTAARTKLVWQVKWMKADDNAGQPTGAVPAPVHSRGWLQAMAKRTSGSTNSGSNDGGYTGAGNQLYRVEINRGGLAGTDPAASATFKWSRDNGSAIFPIASGGGTARVVLRSFGRDERLGLAAGDLVEVEDDRTVLLNLPGRLLPVEAIDRTAIRVTLGGTPDSTIGRDAALHPLLRRWDQSAGDPQAGGLTLTSDKAALIQEGVWLTLEDGIQIRFQTANPAAAPGQTEARNQYVTGDYWLIPARTATADVEWPGVTDAQGNITPLAVPPHGVTHGYAPLAVVRVDRGGAVTVTADCRSSFGGIARPVS